MSTTTKLTLAQYEELVANGYFEGPKKQRIELLRGELREMNPIGPRHCDVVDWLNEWSIVTAPLDRFRIRVQSPVAFVTVDSEPEPDIVWAVRKRYAKAHPTADEIALLIEVADSSLSRDRGEKAEIYAEVGIRDCWIVNLIERTIEVYREPARSGYSSVRSIASGQFIEPLAAPGIQLSVDEMFAGSV